MHVGNEASVSVKVVGESHLQFGTRYSDLRNVYFIPNINRNLISISLLVGQSLEFLSRIIIIFLFKRMVFIYVLLI